MGRSSGGGGRIGRVGRSVSTLSASNPSNFKTGDWITFSGRDFTADGQISKITRGSVRLTNQWGQTYKPLSLSRLIGGTVDRNGRKFTIGG